MEYKLIKRYPGCPLKVGSIISDSIYQIGGGLSIDAREFPEFWEKVIEKTYEVLQYRCNALNENIIATLKEDGLYHFDGSSMIYSPAKTVTNINYKIHSVKRLSDGEVFTIGDKIKDCNSQNTITEFEIKDENGYNWKSIGVKYESGGIDLTFVEKAKQPLFTTEDGVDIFEGDNYHKVNTNNWGYSLWVDANNYSIPAYIKTFSTKEKAQEYIIMNKPCLSGQEVINLLAEITPSVYIKGNFSHKVIECSLNKNFK